MAVPPVINSRASSALTWLRETGAELVKIARMPWNS